MNKREDIFKALFAKIDDSMEFVTSSRSLKAMEDVPGEQMPAFFLYGEPGDIYTQQGPGIPGKVKMKAMLFVYVYEPNAKADANVTPETVLNEAMDAVDIAMRPDDLETNKLTLGGLVNWAWINGEVVKRIPPQGQKAGVMIPIEIMATL